jgi:2-oxoisovalerate dehydrogenase E2 component (dihydrolipoyl transacylase)
VLKALVGVDRGQRVNGRASSPLPLGELYPARSAGEGGARALPDAPQAASVIEVDLTRVAKRLDDSRQPWLQRGIEPGFTPFFAEALLAALRQVPQANAGFDAEARGIRRYPAVHLGLSVADADATTARYGVIRDADTRNVLGLAVDISAVRSGGSVDSSVLDGASVGLSDYGAESALFAVPMVLPGQVLSVRVGAVEERLVVREHGFALAPTAYVCASIDHRALDGMDAGALLMAMKRSLEET